MSASVQSGIGRQNSRRNGQGHFGRQNRSGCEWRSNHGGFGPKRGNFNYRGPNRDGSKRGNFNYRGPNRDGPNRGGTNCRYGRPKRGNGRRIHGPLNHGSSKRGGFGGASHHGSSKRGGFGRASHHGPLNHGPSKRGGFGGSSHQGSFNGPSHQAPLNQGSSKRGGFGGASHQGSFNGPSHQGASHHGSSKTKIIVMPPPTTVKYTSDWGWFDKAIKEQHAMRMVTLVDKMQRQFKVFKEELPDKTMDDCDDFERCLTELYSLVVQNNKQ